MSMAESSDQQNTLGARNQTYFNKVSKSVFEEKWIQDIHRQISDHLVDNLDWIGVGNSKTDKYGKMLDYACGNGLISRILSPYFSTCIGMDISEGMVEEYNATARELKLSEHQMRGIQGDLISPKPDADPVTDELSNFDLVTICMALHHLENPDESIKRLVDRLKIGGILLVIDWASPSDDHQQLQETTQNKEDAARDADNLRHGHHHHHHHHHQPQHELVSKEHSATPTVAHHGFTKEQSEKAFEKAGCGDVSFVLHSQLSRVPLATRGQEQMFFARGRKL